MDKNETLKLYDSISKSITYFRLKKDLELIEGVILDNQTTEVKSKWNFVGKASNKMKDNKANKFTEKKIELEKIISKFELENSNSKYDLYFTDKLKKSYDELFKHDKLELCELFFMLSVILDDKYKYEFANETISELSLLLLGEKDAIKDNLDRANQLFSHISNSWGGRLNSRWADPIKEACKNALLYYFTGNKKYLESNNADDALAFHSNMIVYGLLFGKGVIADVKIVEKKENNIYDVSEEDLATILSFYVNMITKARIKAKEEVFNNDLQIFLKSLSNIRYFVENQIYVQKKNPKANYEKLVALNRFDQELIKEFNLI